MEILVTSRRNAKAAKWFFHKLLMRLRYVPRMIDFDFLMGNFRHPSVTTHTNCRSCEMSDSLDVRWGVNRCTHRKTVTLLARYPARSCHPNATMRA